MIMNKIVFYVAISMNGSICGIAGDLSGFVGKWIGVSKYLTDLKQFKTTLISKDTYEIFYVSTYAEVAFCWMASW